MTSWSKQKLGNIAEIVMGQSPESKYYNDSGIGLPFFCGVKDFGTKYPKETKWTSCANKVAMANDVLFSVRAPVGDINVAAKKCALGRGVCAIKSKNNQSAFLYFLLRANSEKIVNVGNGAVYDAINKPTLEDFDFTIPDLPTQSSIASILSIYDDLIENNEKRIGILEEMTQRLYTEWFVKFKFPGHQKTKMIDSGTGFGMIPKGWTIDDLKSVIDYIRGKSYSSEQISDIDGEYYLVNLKSFNRGGGFRFDGDKYYTGPINEDQKLNNGDVVIAVTDMTTDRAVIARPAHIPKINFPKITFSADVVKIISEKLPLSFIYYALLDRRFTEVTKNKANGANVLHLKPDAILEYKLVIPDQNLLRQFDHLCVSVLSQVDDLTIRNQTLTKIRDLLISQLITGRRALRS